tara:strand:+ start:461 stop:952 length:492 start_codon:yes stop_codon:yes gene_type:complete
MKITRKRLRKTIKEFLDTSYRPAVEAPSVFDQVSNSERAAFIAAMGVVEKSQENTSLNEGDVIKFPPRVSDSSYEDENEDPVGQVYTIQPHGTDLPGDTAHLEADEEDMTPREIEMLRQIMGQRRSLSQRTRADDVQDMEAEIADLEDAYMLGNLADLFDDER